MAFVPPRDRVFERSTSNSQTVFAVTGAIDTSYNAFSASMSVGDTTIGGVVEPGTAFVSGILTYSAANQITVTTVKESKGTFSSSGVKEVFMGQPALAALMVDGAQAWASGLKDQARVNLAALGVIRYQLFTSSGTYTPNANLIHAHIKCGGGGGGGGSVTAASTYLLVGPGGGAGGVSEKLASAATIGASQTVTIGAAGSGGTGSSAGGAGGDTSVGTLCIAKGGQGGGNMSSSSGGVAGAGGSATGAAGDVTFVGSNGSGGYYQNLGGSAQILVYSSGIGGWSPYGSAGTYSGSNSNGQTTNGTAGTGYCAGGSGGVVNQTTSNATGAAGQPGFVLITEFCSK